MTAMSALTMLRSWFGEREDLGRFILLHGAVEERSSTHGLHKKEMMCVFNIFDFKKNIRSLVSWFYVINTLIVFLFLENGWVRKCGHFSFKTLFTEDLFHSLFVCCTLFNVIRFNYYNKMEVFQYPTKNCFVLQMSLLLSWQWFCIIYSSLFSKFQSEFFFFIT